jgi:hypothetical protein
MKPELMSPMMGANCCCFTIGFESMSAHGCEEQWYVRDTRVYIGLCLPEDKNPTSYVSRCIMVAWVETLSIPPFIG